MSHASDRAAETDRAAFFIDGRWATPSSTRTHIAIEAATGEVLGSARLGAESDIDAAVAAARTALDQGPW